MTATDTGRSLITIEDIRAAAEALAPVAVRTPLLPDDVLAAKLGIPLWHKAEPLQRGGSFKFRGAYNYVSNLDPHVRAKGVVAPSSGNHGQGVAMAARIFGIPATVVMPTNVTQAKRAGAERLGARIVLAGTTTHERADKAKEICDAEGMTLVHPYDDPTIIAGQGTIGLEIVSEIPDVETVLVPVGGGGLSAGVSAAVKLLAPSARVIAIEPVSAPKLTRAREAGKPVKLDSTGGLADGLQASQIGTLPFMHHQQFVDDVVLVDDAPLADAMRYLLDRMKIVVEPSGAIVVAALMTGAVKASGKTVTVLSGGNIEFDGLLELLGK
ncbi:MAG TPA: threonine/serine dehydratase [Gemmatimonadaceae bacterium]|jgi:threonine dehydratase|nr:threonine/serine dehydratase [Gemmatimonadaceae bacterium]